MGMIVGGSLAFSIGAVFMKPSQGLTRMYPTMVVVLSFLVGAVFLTRAVMKATTTTTVIISLGIEAALTLGMCALFLGDRLSARQALGVVLVLAGVVMIR